ncbi:hypothetical protein DIPPA_33480 [Diplonema papillatum]|nr:hypothetical protein DIPPA_33480 [Diplonema papillatum]
MPASREPAPAVPGEDCLELQAKIQGLEGKLKAVEDRCQDLSEAAAALEKGKGAAEAAVRLMSLAERQHIERVARAVHVERLQQKHAREHDSRRIAAQRRLIEQQEAAVRSQGAGFPTLRHARAPSASPRASSAAERNEASLASLREKLCAHALRENGLSFRLRRAVEAAQPPPPPPRRCLVAVVTRYAAAHVAPPPAFPLASDSVADFFLSKRCAVRTLAAAPDAEPGSYSTPQAGCFVVDGRSQAVSAAVSPLNPASMDHGDGHSPARGAPLLPAGVASVSGVDERSHALSPSSASMDPEAVPVSVAGHSPARGTPLMPAAGIVPGSALDERSQSPSADLSPPPARNPASMDRPQAALPAGAALVPALDEPEGRGYPVAAGVGTQPATTLLAGGGTGAKQPAVTAFSKGTGEAAVDAGCLGRRDRCSSQPSRRNIMRTVAEFGGDDLVYLSCHGILHDVYGLVLFPSDAVVPCDLDTVRPSFFSQPLPAPLELAALGWISLHELIAGGGSPSFLIDVTTPFLRAQRLPQRHRRGYLCAASAAGGIVGFVHDPFPEQLARAPAQASGLLFSEASRQFGGGVGEENPGGAECAAPFSLPALVSHLLTHRTCPTVQWPARHLPRAHELFVKRALAPLPAALAPLLPPAAPPAQGCSPGAPPTPNADAALHLPSNYRSDSTGRLTCLVHLAVDHRAARLFHDLLGCRRRGSGGNPREPGLSERDPPAQSQRSPPPPPAAETSGNPRDSGDPPAEAQRSPPPPAPETGENPRETGVSGEEEDSAQARGRSQAAGEDGGAETGGVPERASAAEGGQGTAGPGGGGASLSYTAGIGHQTQSRATQPGTQEEGGVGYSRTELNGGRGREGARCAFDSWARGFLNAAVREVRPLHRLRTESGDRASPGEQLPTLARVSFADHAPSTLNQSMGPLAEHCEEGTSGVVELAVCEAATVLPAASSAAWAPFAGNHPRLRTIILPPQPGPQQRRRRLISLEEGEPDVDDAPRKAAADEMLQDPPADSPACAVQERQGGGGSEESAPDCGSRPAGGGVGAGGDQRDRDQRGTAREEEEEAATKVGAKPSDPPCAVSLLQGCSSEGEAGASQRRTSAPVDPAAPAADEFPLGGTHDRTMHPDIVEALFASGQPGGAEDTRWLVWGCRDLAPVRRKNVWRFAYCKRPRVSKPLAEWRARGVVEVRGSTPSSALHDVFEAADELLIAEETGPWLKRFHATLETMHVGVALQVECSRDTLAALQRFAAVSAGRLMAGLGCEPQRDDGATAARNPFDVFVARSSGERLQAASPVDTSASDKTSPVTAFYPGMPVFVWYGGKPVESADRGDPWLPGVVRKVHDGGERYEVELAVVPAKRPSAAAAGAGADARNGARPSAQSGGAKQGDTLPAPPAPASGGSPFASALAVNDGGARVSSASGAAPASPALAGVPPASPTLGVEPMSSTLGIAPASPTIGIEPLSPTLGVPPASPTALGVPPVSPTTLGIAPVTPTAAFDSRRANSQRMVVQRSHVRPQEHERLWDEFSRLDDAHPTKRWCVSEHDRAERRRRAPPRPRDHSVEAEARAVLPLLLVQDWAAAPPQAVRALFQGGGLVVVFVWARRPGWGTGTHASIHARFRTVAKVCASQARAAGSHLLHPHPCARFFSFEAASSTPPLDAFGPSARRLDQFLRSCKSACVVAVDTSAERSYAMLPGSPVLQKDGLFTIEQYHHFAASVTAGAFTNFGRPGFSFPQGFNGVHIQLL